MSVTTLFPKVHIMPAEGKQITVSQSTAISIGLAIPIIAGILTTATVIITLQTRVEVLQNEVGSTKMEVKEMKGNFVEKSTLELELRNINEKLTSIDKSLSRGK